MAHTPTTPGLAEPRNFRDMLATLTLTTPGLAKPTNLRTTLSTTLTPTTPGLAEPGKLHGIQPRHIAIVLPQCSRATLAPMTDPHDHHTVAREDLLFTVEMALLKARRLWPKRSRRGDHDETRLKIIATDVVDHLDLCGIRCVAKGPASPYGTLAPKPSPRPADDADEGHADDAGDG